MPERAQGALEYLLLIGGAVLIAVIVIALLLGLGGTSGDTTSLNAATALCKQQAGRTKHCDGETVELSGKTYDCIGTYINCKAEYFDPASVAGLISNGGFESGGTGDLGYYSTASNWTLSGLQGANGVGRSTNADSATAFEGSYFLATIWGSSGTEQPKATQAFTPQRTGSYTLCAYGANTAGASRGGISLGSTKFVANPGGSNHAWNNYCVTGNLTAGVPVTIQLDSDCITCHFIWDDVRLERNP